MKPHDNTAFIDVDDTLYDPATGKLNAVLIQWIVEQANTGRALILWSARGAEYAQTIAEQTDTKQYFKAIIGKPSLIIDDKGFNWSRWTRVITPIAIENLVNTRRMLGEAEAKLYESVSGSA